MQLTTLAVLYTTQFRACDVVSAMLVYKPILLKLICKLK